MATDDGSPCKKGAGSACARMLAVNAWWFVNKMDWSERETLIMAVGWGSQHKRGGRSLLGDSVAAMR